jgi:hypothetical protein
MIFALVTLKPGMLNAKESWQDTMSTATAGTLLQG